MDILGKLDTLVTSLLLGLLLNALLPVDGYADFRGHPCMRRDILNAIPDNRAEWDGVISFKIECDDGFDYALNSPATSYLNCFFNRTWDPDYMADCNEVMYPSMAKAMMTLRVTVPDASQTLKTDPKEAGLFHFKAGLPVSIASVCNGTKASCKSITHEVIKADDCSKTEENAVSCDTEYSLSMAVAVEFQREWRHPSYTALASHVANNTVLGLTSKGRNATLISSKASFVCSKAAQPVLLPNDEVRCRGCSVGHHFHKPHRKCLPCAYGYYQDQPLSTSCKPCPNVKLVTEPKDWVRIRELTRDRLHSIGGCPIIRNLDNGSVIIEASWDHLRSIETSVTSKASDRGLYVTTSLLITATALIGSSNIYRLKDILF